MSLYKLLEQIKLDADWIGLREVKEKSTYRVIRDGNPQENTSHISHGIMVEVLIDGQFGYYATNDLSVRAIQNAAFQAKEQAQQAAKYSIFKFSEDARPKSVGSYNSSYLKSEDSFSAG